MTKIDSKDFRYDGKRPLRRSEAKTKIADFYQDRADYREQLDELTSQIDERQRMMYADDRYAVLLIFQAMDAAGKDGTIRRVLSGVNPHGVHIHSFKKPSDEEIEHNFLWRTTRRMPERGTIGVFNRSYYEEVLVVRVHPEILTESQRIPDEHTRSIGKVMANRYEDIVNFERYATRNGTRIVKFFLNLSRDEQRKRFIARIDEPDKNWKFSMADARERGYWRHYQSAYNQCIKKTASRFAPWYVIPADDKRNMRLIVATVVRDELQKLPISYPSVSEARRAELAEIRSTLESD